MCIQERSLKEDRFSVSLRYIRGHDNLGVFKSKNLHSNFG